MLRTLDRYIYKEIFPAFFLGLILFTFFLLIDKIFDLTELLINKGVPGWMVGMLLVYILPAFLVLTIPMALLLAILVCFTRLSGDMEIVALKASGISPIRLLRPVLGVAVLAVLATFFLFVEAVPWGNLSFKQLVFQILQARASTGIKERVFNDAFGHFVIYVEEISPSQVGLRGLFISDDRDPALSRIITAKEGRLISDEVTKRITLRLLDGIVHEMDAKTRATYRQVAFAIYDLTLAIENPLVAAAQAPKGDREMTLDELRKMASDVARTQGNPNPFLVEWHKKFSIPAACLVFALVGLPLGIRTHKGGKPAALILALAIILLYYVGLTLGEDLGDRGYVWPWLAMWTPNLLVGAIGFLLLRQVLRERPFPGIDRVGRLWANRSGAVWKRTKSRTPRRGLSPFMDLLVGIQKVPLGYLIDRYLLRQFLFFFVCGLSIGACVFVVGDLIEQADRYMKFRPPLGVLGEHFLYRTPAELYKALPLVVLLSATLLFVTLGRNNELTALKAGGVSLYRVTGPLLLLALLITGGAFAFQEGLLPTLNQRGEEVDRIKIRGQRLRHLQRQTQLWFRGGSNRIFHINLFDPEAQEMSGVTVLELSPSFGIERRIDAAVVRWENGAWRFENGVERSFPPGRRDRAEAFQRRSLSLPESFQDFMEIKKSPALMSYRELEGYVRKLEEGGHRVGKYLVELYGKLAFPFVNLIMVIVGIPFALHSPRSGRVIGIALAILLAIAYWLTHSLAVALARLELLPPLAAAWSANVVFAALGLTLFLRTRT